MQPHGNGHAPTPRLSELLIAIVHGLRDVRALIVALVNDNHESIVGYTDTTVMLIEGPKVADALESIAQRLETEETK